MAFGNNNKRNDLFEQLNRSEKQKKHAENLKNACEYFVLEYEGEIPENIYESIKNIFDSENQLSDSIENNIRNIIKDVLLLR